MTVTKIIRWPNVTEYGTAIDPSHGMIVTYQDIDTHPGYVGKGSACLTFAEWATLCSTGSVTVQS